MTTIENNQTNPQTEGRSTGPVGFESGNAVNTTAILMMIAAMMKLYDYKNEAFEMQTKTASEMANDFSTSQIELGEQEFKESFTQGIFGVFGGLGSAAMLGLGMAQEKSLKPFEDDLKGSEKYLKNLDGIEPKQELRDSLTSDAKGTVKTDLEKMISEIRDGKVLNHGEEPVALTKKETELVEKLEPNERKALRKAVKERVTEKQNNLSNERQNLRTLFDKRQMGSTAIQGLTQGAGQIGGGVYKKEQGDQRAENTQYQTAQQQFQSLTKETEGQSDQDLQAALTLTQEITDLDKSNNAILSA